MSNTKIWDALAKTDPAHTKRFSRSGGFKGTSVKPIYMTRKMTELFGPAGEGWGMNEPKFDVVNAGDEILVYCTASIWWGSGHTVYGVGGDKVLSKNKNGPFYDDEAFKKSYTDALSNAMKQIGMAADIHMGQHDDDKYVREVAREIAEERQHDDAREKTTKDDDWVGPMNKTALKAALRELHRDVLGCDDVDSLDALLAERAAIIVQARSDLPEWMVGDGGDKRGIDGAIEMMRAEFNSREAMKQGYAA